MIAGDQGVFCVGADERWRIMGMSPRRCPAGTASGTDCRAAERGWYQQAYCELDIHAEAYAATLLGTHSS